MDGIVLGLRPADARDGELGPELRRVGQGGHDGVDLGRRDAGQEQREEHLHGPDRVEALRVGLLVLVTRHEDAGGLVEERGQDPGFGVGLVRAALGRKGGVEGGRQVAQHAPAGRVDAVNGDVLDDEPVLDRARGRGRPAQDGGLVPAVAPAVAERQLDQLRVDLGPGRAGVRGRRDAERAVVGGRQVEAGLPRVQDRDDARAVEVARRLPPVKVLDEGRNEGAEVGHVVAGPGVDGAQAVGQDGHLGQVVVLGLGVETRLQRIRQAASVSPVDLLRDAAVGLLEV